VPTKAGTAALTTLTLIAFAANSILCRAALSGGSVDPFTFTALRFTSGAAMLLLISGLSGRRAAPGGSWTSAGWLLVYAFPFSLAYVSLTASTGALILFGAVQVTMMSAALWMGERLRLSQWTGFALAVAGLVYLLLPGLSAPSPAGAAGMSLAGVAWAVYSLRGRRVADPLMQTTGNFVRFAPFSVLVTLFRFPALHVEPRGAVLALMSGALASGVGYVIWYAALRGLSSQAAAVVQLLVPVLAAAGGVLLLGESLSPRLLLSAAFVIGGIALAVRKEPSGGEASCRAAGRG
jgi:drug/metabolite transporter (DMT)-like permease